MVDVRKCVKGCYCGSCGEHASWILAINDSRVIVKGREVLCNQCMAQLKAKVAKITTHNKPMRKRSKPKSKSTASA